MRKFKEYEFTEDANKYMKKALSDEYFFDKDSEIIYNTLKKNIRVISFGEYLKRYIYKVSGINKPYNDVTIAEYQLIIKNNFELNNTPKSFEYNSTKISALSKNWLTQQTVNRKVVFLLGFGLRMSVDDVNDFLIKALCEQGINAKNVFEVICWYCYKNKYPYYKYEELLNKCENTFYNVKPDNMIQEMDKTISFRHTLNKIDNDEKLVTYLNRIKLLNNKYSITAKNIFNKLYDEVRVVVANILNQVEEINHNDEIKKIAEKTQFTYDKISPSDIEKVINSAIPIDDNGNLIPGKRSSLNDLFRGRRFSRQHFNDIVNNKTEINRFDLITLNFLIYSQLDEIPAKKRYEMYIRKTNIILSECNMGKLYIVNPYECFILMCIISESPLSTYTDVLEMSYSNRE